MGQTTERTAAFRGAKGLPRHRRRLRPMPHLPALRVILAAPRGFCAGVDRAIRMVEEALRRRGAPVYVRHEIVHNRSVVQALERQGAVFVEELAEVPPESPVVFSAHGVARAVTAEAGWRGLTALDATCPLVSKVHREADRLYAGGGPQRRCRARPRRRCGRR